MKENYMFEEVNPLSFNSWTFKVWLLFSSCPFFPSNQFPFFIVENILAESLKTTHDTWFKAAFD